MLSQSRTKWINLLKKRPFHLTQRQSRRSKIINLYKKTAVLIALLLSSTANATLIELDSSYGANTITRDTSSNLEWLDPLYGAGWLPSTGYCCYSYNQTKNEFGAGGYFEGFRYATGAEVEQLFLLSAGINESAPDYDDSVLNLINILGDTFSADFGYANFYATTAYYDNNGVASLASLETNVLANNQGAYNTNAYISQNSVDPNANGGPYGSFLVRNTVQVSEPPTLGILLLGMTAIYTRHRKLHTFTRQKLR